MDGGIGFEKVVLVGVKSAAEETWGTQGAWTNTMI